MTSIGLYWIWLINGFKPINEEHAMSTSKFHRGLYRGLRQAHRNWIENIPPWVREEQPSMPSNRQTLAWLKYLRHIRQETKRYRWWYNAMAPVRLAKRVWIFLVDNKAMSISVAILMSIAWYIIGSQLNSRATLDVQERTESLFEVIPHPDLELLLSRECTIPVLKSFALCEYRVGSDYIEYTEPLFQNLDRLRTIQTELKHLSTLDNPKSIDETNAYIEEHLKIQRNLQTLQDEMTEFDIDVLPLLPNFPSEQLQILEQIVAEDLSNQEAVSEIVSLAESYNIIIELEGPVTTEAMTDLEHLRSFLTTMDQWISRANAVDMPLTHENPLTFKFTPRVSSPLQTRIDGADWGEIWRPQLVTLLKLEECAFLQQNSPLKESWTEDTQALCMSQQSRLEENFKPLMTSQSTKDYKMGVVSVIDKPTLESIEQIAGYAATLPWQATPQKGVSLIGETISNLHMTPDELLTVLASNPTITLPDAQMRHILQDALQHQLSVEAQSDEDSTNNVSKWMTIGLKQAQYGFKEDASVTFQKVLDTAGSIDNDYQKSEILKDIATALANASLTSTELQTLFELTINTAKSIDYDRYKAEVFKAIVQSFSNTTLTSTHLRTLFELAINTANSISNDGYKALALSNIATAQANAGLYELAINTANSIRGDYYKAIALSNIATAQANAGLIYETVTTFELAINTANSIDNTSTKSQTLSNIATAQANNDLINEAIKTFKLSISTATSIGDANSRSNTLKDIATAQANTELVNEAIKTFELAINTTNSIDDNYQKFEALNDIALTQVECEFREYATITFKTSLTTAKSIEKDRNKYEAINQIVSIFSTTNLNQAQRYELFKQALDTADSIGYSGAKSEVINKISSTLSTTDLNQAQIHELFKQALAMAESLEGYANYTISHIQKSESAWSPTIKTRANQIEPPINLDENKSPTNTRPTLISREFPVDAKLTLDSTFHTPLAWMLNPPKSQSILPKEIVTLSKQLNLRTPPKCIRDGINLGYTEGFIAYWTDALQRQVRAEELRDQYRKSKGDPFESIEKWYGVIESPDRSTDPCVQPFPFPLLTTEQLDALDDELNEVKRDSSKFKDLIRQANRLSIDTSDWGAPFQFDTWEAEIKMVSGLNTRMTDLIRRGQRMGLNLKDSLFKDISVLAKPYTTEQTDHLQREIERIEGIIDNWQKTKQSALAVGYAFPKYPTIDNVTQEILDWHTKYIPQTPDVRRFMRRISFKSILTGSVTPIGASEAIQITNGFSISSTEIPEALYCISMADEESIEECSLDNGLPLKQGEYQTGLFIRVLSYQMGMVSCTDDEDCATGFRIPTVDEWRYAALAYQQTYYAGSNIADEVAWYGMSNDSPFPIQLKRPNGFGLYDMSGNVEEWVQIGEHESGCIGGRIDSSHEAIGVMYKINSGSQDCGLRLIRN